MSGGDGQRTRREYLRVVTGTGLVGLAGCSGLGGDSASTDSDEPTESPTETQTETPANSTPTPNGTATPEQDESPVLTTATTSVEENGGILGYGVGAEDDDNLSEVTVEYGGQQVDQWTEDLEDEFQTTGRIDTEQIDPEEGYIKFTATDSAGQTTEEIRNPDEQAPTITELNLAPTTQQGEISLEALVEDNKGLDQLNLYLDGETILQQDISGNLETSLDTTIDITELATLGEENTLTAELIDFNGNTTRQQKTTYTRKFDVMEDTRLDIGAIHYPWMGKHLGSTVTENEGEPAVGHYEDWKNSPMNEVANRHIDEMQGNGINKLMIDFGEWDTDYERFEHFQEAELFDEIDFEAYYVVSQALRRDRDLEADFEFMRENMLNRDNYNTVDGRPVVQLYWPAVLTTEFNDEYIQMRSDLVDEHGSLANFTKYMRDELTVNDTEPFMIATTNLEGVYGFKEEYSEFWNEFDGLTNWVGEVVPNETISNEESLEQMEENYRGIAEYAGDDQVFWPMVIPGFDDRHNEAWGQDRRIPRSNEYFQEMLQLAEEYGDGRINIYSWNEWTEGSQIEPGSFRGEEYGTEYLEVIEQFQQEGG